MKTVMKEYWRVVLVEPTKCIIKHPFIAVLNALLGAALGFAPFFVIGLIQKIKDKFSKKKEKAA